jgi:hypothetical protein
MCLEKEKNKKKKRFREYMKERTKKFIKKIVFIQLHSCIWEIFYIDRTDHILVVEPETVEIWQFGGW